MFVLCIYFSSDAILQRLDAIAEEVKNVSVEQREIAQEVKAQRVAVDFVMQKEFDPWEKISNGSRSDKATITLSPLIAQFYGLRMTECQLLGLLPSSEAIKSAHIWPNWTDGLQLPLFGLETADAQHPRNFLRLHSDVEQAFDHKRLTFRLQGAELMIHVLDPSLLSEQIGKTGRTFNDCHQLHLSLTFSTTNRPYHRLLAVHAQCSFRNARKKGWIQEQDLTDGEIWATEMARHSLNGGGQRTMQWLHRNAQSPQPPTATSASSATAAISLSSATVIHSSLPVSSSSVPASGSGSSSSSTSSVIIGSSSHTHRRRRRK